MKHRVRTQSGYIALMAVLIVGAASLAIASALLLTAADSQRSTLVAQQSAQARNLATACAEEALQQINTSTSFTGTNNLSMGQGACSYTVANAGGSNRTITASGTVDTVVRRLQISATVGATTITISSWQEVAN
jgi:DeoR/GlpR family transcriptional regulator of sugar metabolism